jgi:hypothetical protein
MKAWLSNSESGIGIPYPCTEPGPDGRRNYGYFDLKRQPELISKVPELKNTPELRRLVEAINNPDSLFRTLACEKAMGKSETSRFRKRLTSFVSIAFDVLAWNQRPGNYEMLFRAFEEFVGLEYADCDAIGVEFCIEPASFLNHGASGWCLTLWNYGYGSTEPETRRQWSRGVTLLEKFFLSGSAQVLKLPDHRKALLLS